MTILFDDESQRPKVSAYSLSVIQSRMIVAGISEVVITSVQRSPLEQARAMYVNCIKLGPESQKKLYGPYGDQVIDVFVARRAVTPALTPELIVSAMLAKILEIGPANVSHHCADPAKRNVIDISASRMTASARMNFHLSIQRDPRIDKFFDPFTEPADPAFHLEIPQSS